MGVELTLEVWPKKIRHSSESFVFKTTSFLFGLGQKMSKNSIWKRLTRVFFPSQLGCISHDSMTFLMYPPTDFVEFLRVYVLLSFWELWLSTHSKAWQAEGQSEGGSDNFTLGLIVQYLCFPICGMRLKMLVAALETVVWYNSCECRAREFQ